MKKYLAISGVLLLLITGFISVKVVREKNDNRSAIVTEKTANAILTLGANGKGNGDFLYPTSIAVNHNGEIYVVDQKLCIIEKFNHTGKFIKQWGGEGKLDGQFEYPHGIAIDNNNIIYIADTNNSRIQSFDENGKHRKTIGSFGNYGIADSEFNQPVDVDIDESGDIFVIDRANNRVQRFDRNGRFLLKWGSEGTNDGQFKYPSSIAVSTDGFVYIADTLNNRIQKFTANGKFLLKWTFGKPFHLDVDKNGLVYVKGGDQVYIYNSSGILKAINRVEKSHGNEISDITIDDHCHIYCSSLSTFDITEYQISN